MKEIRRTEHMASITKKWIVHKMCFKSKTLPRRPHGVPRQSLWCEVKNKSVISDLKQLPFEHDSAIILKPSISYISYQNIPIITPTKCTALFNTHAANVDNTVSS